jgi:cytochrome c2
MRAWKSVRAPIIECLSIGLLFFSIFYWFLPALAQNAQSLDGSFSAGAKVLVNELNFDFGDVEEGIPVTHSFTIKNVGSQDLHLKASASCGCTTLTLTKSDLAPDQSTLLKVDIDTAMKQNLVTKHVYLESNDAGNPTVTLSLSMRLNDPHRAMSETGKAKIFNNQLCASCHVVRGEGKFGRELYNADCAMCHGPKAEGAVGPALFGPYDRTAFLATMKNILEEGSKTHRSMPGFLKSHGGPLEQAQVDSILSYLGTLSKSRGL